MVTYFIADNTGAVYAHDITNRETAESILAEVKNRYPNYEALEIEILEDEQGAHDEQ